MIKLKNKTLVILPLSIIVFFFIYFKFFKVDEANQVIELNNQEESFSNSNIIKDIKYSSKDLKGNEYFLKADEGIIDQNISNLIFLKSVKAIINLKDYKSVEISSDFGKYNINNYDTIFSKNVLIAYLDNQISGDYLDFSLDNNLMIISRNVVLKNDTNSLQADVIEVNIETKAIKIFMYEENKKVNIQSLN